MAKPHAVIVANPHAGGGRARAIAIRAKSALTSAGINVTLHFPESREQLQIISAQSCAKQPDVVLACGGDGTFHDILQSTIASNTTIGIIPCGTGNDIARSLGLTSKISDSFFHEMANSVHNVDCELNLPSREKMNHLFCESVQVIGQCHCLFRRE